MSQAYRGFFPGNCNPNHFIPEAAPGTPEHENWLSACRYWNQKQADGEDCTEPAQHGDTPNGFGIGYIAGTDDE